MLNTYDKAKNFSHKQMWQYIVLQDAFDLHAFLITSFNGYEPNELEHLKSVSKAEHPEIKTYDDAYDLLIGKPSSMPDFTKAINL
jgi:hypothetical protein